MAEGQETVRVAARERQLGAADTIRTLHAARQQMDQGIISGLARICASASFRMAHNSVLPTRIVNNTEAFRVGYRAGRRLVGPKPLAPTVERHREFILGVMGGSIAPNEASFAPGIIDIQEGMARGAIEQVQSECRRRAGEPGAVPGADQQGLAMAQALGPVAMPPPYAPLSRPKGAPTARRHPAPAQPSAGAPANAPFSLRPSRRRSAAPADAAAGARLISRNLAVPWCRNGPVPSPLEELMALRAAGMAPPPPAGALRRPAAPAPDLSSLAA